MFKFITKLLGLNVKKMPSVLERCYIPQKT